MLQAFGTLISWYGDHFFAEKNDNSMDYVYTKRKFSKSGLSHKKQESFSFTNKVLGWAKITLCEEIIDP